MFIFTYSYDPQVTSIFIMGSKIYGSPLPKPYANAYLVAFINALELESTG